MSFGSITARLAASAAAGSLLLTTAPTATPTALAAAPGAPSSAGTATTRSEPDDGRRTIVGYTVRPGDTATELAVRFHAWTAELIALNHLGAAGTMYVGQRLRIPVVTSRAGHTKTPPKTRQRTGQTSRQETKHRTRQKARTTSHSGSGTSVAAERLRIRRLIESTARRYGVDPELALAVSWQEAGWRMHHVSSAGAIGAMQVLKGTGAWMSLYVGRRLDLHNARDNVAAGVKLLKVLEDMTGSRRKAIGAYYQGVGSVLREGLDPGTRDYLANVRAIQRRLERGLPPST